MTNATIDKPVSIEALEEAMLIEQVSKQAVKAKKNGAKPQIDLTEWNIKVAEIKRKIDQSEGDILQAYVDLGAVLNHVKKLLKHGGWLPWLESQGISQPTAWRYMSLATSVEKARAADPNYSPANDWTLEKFWGHSSQHKDNGMTQMEALNAWLAINTGVKQVNKLKVLHRQLQRLVEPVIELTYRRHMNLPPAVQTALDAEVSEIYMTVYGMMQKGFEWTPFCARCRTVSPIKEGIPPGWIKFSRSAMCICPDCIPKEDAALLSLYHFLPSEWQELKEKSAQELAQAALDLAEEKEEARVAAGQQRLPLGDQQQP